MPERTDGYREFAPHPALADAVECFWAKRGGDGHTEARIVPDGSTDVIVDAQAADAEVIGTMLRPKILRIRHALGLLHRARVAGHDISAARRPDRMPDWMGVALQTGFYDQAHFIRDFRAITGVTPAVWLGA